LLFAIFSIFGFLVWQGYAQTLSQAETKAISGADIVAEHTTWVLGTGVRLLDHIAADLSRDPTNIESTEGGSAGRAIAPIVYGADGAARSPEPLDNAPLSIKGTDYFTALEGGERWSISAHIADPSIVLASRIDGPQGTFGGAVVLVFPGDFLARVWSAQNLGPDSTVSLIRNDGKVVARFPGLTGALDLGPLPVFEKLRASSTGSYTSVSSPADGVARIVGFKHIDDLDLIAVASVSQDSVLSGLWSAVRTVLWLLGPIALALFAGSFLTARLLRGSEKTRRSLAKALEHNDVLFKEIHHRVKNNLQSVSALLNLQPIPPSVKEEMRQRIAAMSAVHEHIYRSNNFDTVDLKSYLETLVQDITAGSGKDIEVVVKFDVVNVANDLATPLGLIFIEAVSNSIKHAFPDGRRGQIALTLENEGGGMGRLTVADNGTGFDAQQPVKGIGRKLIAALTQQIEGKSHFTSGSGSRFEVTFAIVP
jgi:two-component sensor histidine kinase